MRYEELLTPAAKCLHYAWNRNHDCPEELRNYFGCEYHKKLEEEKAMRKSIQEKQEEISEGLLENLESGEEIEEINEFERKVLEDYYLEGKTFNEIAEDTDYTTGHCSNKKREAVERIKDNNSVDEDQEDDFAKAKAKTEELAEALNGKKENVENTKINVKDMSLEMPVEEPQKIEKDKYIELLTDKVEEIILESEFANKEYDQIKVDTSELWILDTMKAAVEGDERAQKFLKSHLKELG